MDIINQITDYLLNVVLPSIAILTIFVYVMTEKDFKKSVITAIVTYAFVVALSACNII